MTRVLCQAECDKTPEGWRVTVTGLAPYEQTKVYDLEAGSEADAAFQAMDRFRDEMEGLG